MWRVYPAYYVFFGKDHSEILEEGIQSDVFHIKSERWDNEASKQKRLLQSRTWKIQILLHALSNGGGLVLFELR